MFPVLAGALLFQAQGTGHSPQTLCSKTGTDKMPELAQTEYRGGPSRLRAVLVSVCLGTVVFLLAQLGTTGKDEIVGTLGRIELTARLAEAPEEFPVIGGYRYTYVVKYEVIDVHRQDPDGNHPLKRGDEVCVGHYQPFMPRSKARDDDCGDMQLGGKLSRIVTGESHRMALDYNLENLAPGGVLDYCFPLDAPRFFALWTNPAWY